MNLKHRHQNLNQWLTVATASLIVSTVNILHVITGLAQNPKGYTYLATGHYYLDYFYYLQYIALGLTRHWLPINYFATDDIGVRWRVYPYVLLGKIAWIFHWSPMMAYWLAVFFITFLVLVGFYLLINLMLKNEPFYLKMTAFSISILSGPFYRIININNQLSLGPYDFWYGPGSFLRRFGVVPYHLLGLLLLILIIIIVNRFWGKITNLSLKKVLIYSLIITSIVIIIISFSPFSVASFIPTVLIISAINFLKKKNIRLKIIIFNLVLFVLTLPTVFLLRNNSEYKGISFETLWIVHPSWWYLLLNLGPVIFFIPFGLLDYWKRNNLSKQLLLVFTLVSYGLFFSPLAYYLGTHNLRFFSPISHILFAVLATLGIKKIAVFFKEKKGGVFIFLSILLIIYSGLLAVFSIKQRIFGEDIRVPNTILSYIPNPLIDGIRTLRNYPEEKMVLTGPYGQIGMLVPVFGYRRVYVGHQDVTPDLVKKQTVSNRFFSGEMTDDEARLFLKKNRLGIVVLSVLDKYDQNKVNQFRFLKRKFSNQYITIWEVADYEQTEKN